MVIRALLMIAFVTSGTTLWAQKPTIGVMDFEGRGVSQTEVAALSDRLRNELFRLDKFQVVERGMMEIFLKEQDFQLSGCTSNECLVEVGQLLGAQMMVGGSISKVGDIFTASARIVNVETGQVIMVADYDLDGKINDMLTIGMRELTLRLVNDEKAPPTAVERTMPTPVPGPSLAPGDYVRGKGGLEPCLASACIGPRVGLEMNEGYPIESSEWIGFGGPIAGSFVGGSLGNLISLGSKGYMAYDRGYLNNDVAGFLASYFIGPRVGAQLGQRKIRTVEWLRLIPCVNIYPCIVIPLAAFQGKTMSEIEVAEGLRK